VLIARTTAQEISKSNCDDRDLLINQMKLLLSLGQSLVSTVHVNNDWRLTVTLGFILQ